MNPSNKTTKQKTFKTLFVVALAVVCLLTVAMMFRVFECGTCDGKAVLVKPLHVNMDRAGDATFEVPCAECDETGKLRLWELFR